MLSVRRRVNYGSHRLTTNRDGPEIVRRTKSRPLTAYLTYRRLRFGDLLKRLLYNRRRSQLHKVWLTKHTHLKPRLTGRCVVVHAVRRELCIRRAAGCQGRVVVAGGGIGSKITASLLAAKRFKITAVSREDTTSAFPSELTVKKGSYDDESFLVSALTSQDALIITLSHFADPSTQGKLIAAAGKAGYKAATRAEIDKLPNSDWIAVVSNPWLELGLKSGFMGLDLTKKHATLYDGGEKFNISTMAQVGRGVAALLSLPVTSANGRLSLSRFRNSSFYVSSFLASQDDLFAALQKADTKEKWTVEHKQLKGWFSESLDMLAAGNMAGLAGGIFGSVMTKGYGGDYQDRLQNEELGLPKEDLDAEVARVVKGA
ncbi:hypothetical protein MRB53_038632 [Persea americana]|nr:hypothetical protein MRB53_038632 [Persea americana]